MSNFIEQLEKLGYDSGATAYSENSDFWKKVGLTKSDLDVLIAASL